MTHGMYGGLDAAVCWLSSLPAEGGGLLCVSSLSELKHQHQGSRFQCYKCIYVHKERHKEEVKDGKDQRGVVFMLMREESPGRVHGLLS